MKNECGVTSSRFGDLHDISDLKTVNSELKIGGWFGALTKDFKREAMGLIEGKLLFDVPLRRFTSMRVGGPADTLLFPKNVDELRKIVLHRKRKNIPMFILGKGTNLIVRKSGVRGWVVSLTQGIKKVRMEGEVVEAEAGLSLQRLIQFSVEKGLTGLESFSGIPGTVGGALAMNAGAWGAEIGDLVLSVMFMKENGEIVEKFRQKLRFSYRQLSLPSSWIILKARFRLQRGKKEEILERVKSYSEMRKKMQPLEYASAGSIFKNPKEGPAGRWIEETGLKGVRIGQAMVSDRHANFIINLGRASSDDVIDLMERVQKKVYEQKGIFLEKEVKVVGE